MPPDALESAVLDLCLGPSRVRVIAGCPAVLSWLQEFLGPAWRTGEVHAPTGGVTVSFEAQAGGVETLRKRLANATPLPPVEGFTYDGSWSRHRAWRDPTGWRWAADETRDTHYGVAPDGCAMRVVATTAKDHGRVALLRVVREVATRGAQRAGWLPLHASAFTLAGEGVTAVLGPRRAGKSSVLAQALLRGARLVANDRVFVDLDDTAWGMATIVALRIGTLTRLPALAATFGEARYDRARTLVECQPGVERPSPAVAREAELPGISPVQLAHLCGTGMAGPGRLARLLFPSIDVAAAGIVLEPMGPSEVSTALADALLHAGTPARTSELFAPEGAERLLDPTREREACERVAQRVRAWRLRLGPSAEHDDLPMLLRELAPVAH